MPLFEGLSKNQLGDFESDDSPGSAGGAGADDRGTAGPRFFIVLEGEVEVRQGDRVIATRRPGEYVGAVALADNRPRTATVVAATPVSIEVLNWREFVSLLAEAPELSEQIIATMARRLCE